MLKTNKQKMIGYKIQKFEGEVPSQEPLWWAFYTAHHRDSDSEQVIEEWMKLVFNNNGSFKPVILYLLITKTGLSELSVTNPSVTTSYNG